MLQAHPDVIFTISAGNDGPGLSTMGFPGSANRALTVGATFPVVMLGAVTKPASDPVSYFSARGGELAKPDIAARVWPIPPCRTGMWETSGRVAPAWPRPTRRDSPRCSSRRLLSEEEG